jgi:hypothetical protein
MTEKMQSLAIRRDLQEFFRVEVAMEVTVVLARVVWFKNDRLDKTVQPLPQFLHSPIR